MTAFIFLVNLQPRLGSRCGKEQEDSLSLSHSVSAGVSWELELDAFKSLFTHSRTCLAPGLGTLKLLGAGTAGFLRHFSLTLLVFNIITESNLNIPPNF